MGWVGGGGGCLVGCGEGLAEDAHDGGAVRSVGAGRREAARGQGRGVGEGPAAHGPEPVLLSRARYGVGASRSTCQAQRDALCDVCVRTNACAQCLPVGSGSQAQPAIFVRRAACLAPVGGAAMPTLPRHD